MLTAEENETLCRVGPGSAMGDVFRQYWLPILLSSELPEADCPPLRVRVLGEELIAFRQTDSAIGLLANACPHRGASLFFGRNEDRGLRCVYHGWKFDTSGACVDMPNEPAESNFKHKVRALAYPCRERNGVIWAYLGPRTEPGPLPDIEWSLLPPSQVYISKRFQNCNWAQALEGGIDSSHSAFLHATLSGPPILGDATRGMDIRMREKHAHFETLQTTYGTAVAARRDADTDHFYWRITQFLMPSYTLVPPYGESAVGGHIWVPLDDQTTMAWTFTWHPARALTQAEVTGMRNGKGLHYDLRKLRPATSAPDGAWKLTAGPENDYLRDRAAMRTESFSGLPGVAIQDAAAQESMGAIYNRVQEHLGASDAGIIQVRKQWLDAAQALRERGVIPAGVDDPAAYRVRAAGVILPKATDWVQGSADWLAAREGVLLQSA
ncbi:MAG TPA: Rieske 2Fe-2S domain-containing protein [Chloroflexota bacterium]|nr:Rieske 2Fe-2S domain-containing protein [Chloroflexota bacterium]